MVIQTEGRELCLPISTQDSDESWEKRNIHYNNIAEAWKKLEWFSPLWISRNDVNKLLEGARVDSADEAIQNFNFHASTIYTLSFEATCIEQVMGSAPCLVEIQPLAREAYLAFYAGYKSASIAALIPAIEGAITRILPSEMQDFPVMEKVNKVIEGAISYAAEQHYDNMWTPTEYKSTNAGHQSPGEKKLPKEGSFQVKRRACERMRLIRIFEIAKPPTIQTTAKPIMK